MKMKILIVRFSSFGDVLQTLSVAGRLGESLPDAEIHWVTRAEFVPLIHSHPRVTKAWALPRGAGFWRLRTLGRQLQLEKFTHIYDAHNNLRSHLLAWQLAGPLCWRRWTGRQKLLRRSIYRWRRFLLFRLRKNLFPKPFSGQLALLEPLAQWGLPIGAPAVPQLFLHGNVTEKARSRLPSEWMAKGFVALAPSAAFPLKRWPLEYWKELIRLFPDTAFAVLGGGADGFLKALEAVAPGRVMSFAGQLSYLESAALISLSRALVSNDTGLMHVAEQIGKPCIALMGPAPFGYPSRPATKILERDLPCRPCSKHGQGPCVNADYQKCLADIRADEVAKNLKEIL